MIVWTALLVAATATAPAMPSRGVEGETLVADFARALMADDQAALDAIAVSGKADPLAWRSAIGVISRYDELSLRAEPRASRVDGDLLLIDVALDGSGTTRGGRREREALPRSWQLSARREAERWRLVGAVTAERRLGLALAKAKAGEIEAALAASPDLDRRRFDYELADSAAEALDGGAEALEWVLRTSRERGDAVASSVALQMRSYVNVVTQRWERAEADAREALAVATAGHELEEMSASRFSIGTAQWMAGDVASAVATLRSAADDIDRLRDPTIALRSLYMSGVLAAESSPRTGLEIARELSAHERRYPSARTAMDAAFLLGHIYGTLGNTELSAQQFEVALQGAEALGDLERVAIGAGSLAHLRLEAGDDAGARALLRRAAAVESSVSGEPRVFLFVDVAEDELRHGELAASDASFEHALELARATGKKEIVASVQARWSGLRLRQGRAAEALALAQSAAADAELPPELAYLPISPWIAYTNLGRAQRALGRPGDAEAAWRAAIDEIEASSAAPSGDALVPVEAVAERLEPYRLLVDGLAAGGRADEALVVADRLRARALRDQLERGKVDVSGALSAEERGREHELEQRLVSLNRSMLAARDDATLRRLGSERSEARLAVEAVRTEVRALHADLRQRRADVLTDSLTGWQRAIPADGAVLELLLAEDHTIAFFVAPGRDGKLAVEVRELPGEAALKPAIAALTSALEAGDPTFVPPGRRLYDALVAPFAARLAGIRTLCVIPDGVLWRVPFHLLPDETGRALIERVAVFRAPSLTSLAMASDRDAPRREPTLLAFGNPAVAGSTADLAGAVERGPTLGPLPDAEREVQGVARLYGAQRSELHVREAARELSLKQRAGSFDVLHLATHGLLDDQAPLFSALVLAAPRGDDEDGLLEVREIADLDLHARLAVLSACDTGRGHIRPGEGVIGMSWAFLAAGVPTIVVSDWRAPSAATASLMVDFHRALLRGLQPAAALREAQLARRRDPANVNPYYWGGFTVVGVGW
jgi:CHAT domain-containing protein